MGGSLVGSRGSNGRIGPRVKLCSRCPALMGCLISKKYGRQSDTDTLIRNLHCKRRLPDTNLCAFGVSSAHAKLRTASLIPFSYAAISLSNVALTSWSICFREGSALNHASDCRTPSAKVVVAQ